MRIFAILLATASCASIPDLEFAPDDGGSSLGNVGDARVGDGSAPLSLDAASDGSTPNGGNAGDDAAAPPGDDASAPPPDAAPPPPADAAPPPVDASPPPPPQDASTGCVLPSGAALCCGNVPCVGNKCAGNCDLCAACTGSLVCCVAPNGKTATCGANVASCGHGAGNGDH